MGGRDHTTHHLSYAGYSDGQVALIFIGLSLLHVFLTFVMCRYIPVWKNLHTVIFVTYAVALPHLPSSPAEPIRPRTHEQAAHPLRYALRTALWVVLLLGGRWSCTCSPTARSW